MVKWFSRHWFPLIVFSALSSVSFIWFNGLNVGFASGGLYNFFYNIPYILHNAFYLYHTDNFIFANYFLIPIGWIFYALYLLAGHNYVLTQEIFFYIIIFFTLVYFYFFVYELLEYQKHRKFISIVSAIFYVFNFYTIYLITTLFGNGFYFIIFFPAILYYFLNFAKTGRFHNILLLSIILSLFSFDFFDLSYFYIIFILFAFILFYVREFQKINLVNSKVKISKYFIGFIIVVLINSWYILPFILSMFHIYIIHKKLIPDFYDNYCYISHLTDILQSLKGNFIKNPNIFRNYHITSWLDVYYDNVFFIFLSFTIIFIILIPILASPRKYYSLMVLVLVGIFFGVGADKPFGSLKLYLFGHLPFSTFFINTNAFFPLTVIAYSILFGVSLSIIYGFALKYRIKFISSAIIIFIACFIYMFPIWSGKVFDQYLVYHGEKLTARVKIPAYYEKIDNYFRSKKIDYNILVLPFSYWLANYKWRHGFFGSDYCGILYGHSCFSSLAGEQFSQDIIFDIFQNNSFKGFSSIGHIFSVRYIVIRNDMIVPKSSTNNSVGSKFYLKYIKLKNFKYLLQKNTNFELIKKIGKLDVYKIQNKYFTNFIYAPKQLIFISDKSCYFNNSVKKNNNDYNSVSIVPYIAMMPNYNIRSVIFFSMLGKKEKTSELNKIRKSYKIRSKTMFIDDGNIHRIESITRLPAPIIEFRKINPTKYIAIVHNAKVSFPLILNQRYSRFWNLYPEKYHINRKKLRLLNYKCSQNSKIHSDCMSIKKISYNIKKRYISAIGNKFVSEDLNGTIQNNNLPSGHIFQTMFQKPYLYKYHFMANGYANSWWININNIKKLGNQYYRKNKNGTYDFEFIIDFWPQRLFYIGIIISVTTIIVFGLYLIYDAVKKRKTK